MSREEQMKLAIRILDPVVSYRSPRLKDVKALQAIVPEHIRHWAADDLAVHLVKSLTTSDAKWNGVPRNGRDTSAGDNQSILHACTRPKRSDSGARSDPHERTVLKSPT
jgi:hypothetical protein